SHLLVIRKRIFLSRDLLPYLVPLAGDDQRISRPQHGDGGPDRLPPVADFLRLWYRLQDRPADRGRVLRARIVVRHDDDIRQLSRAPAHDGPLARVTIAAAAEDQNHAPGGERPNGLRSEEHTSELQS